MASVSSRAKYSGRIVRKRSRRRMAEEAMARVRAHLEVQNQQRMQQPVQQPIPWPMRCRAVAMAGWRAACVAAMHGLLLAATLLAWPARADEPPGGLAASPVPSACGQADSAFARGVTAELALLRTEPQAFVPWVAQRLATVRQQGTYVREGRVYRALEGEAPFAETLALLQASRPLPALQADACLSAAARRHAADPGGAVRGSHRGSDGSMPDDRVREASGQKLACGEVISFGVGHPRDVVLDLLIDDGVADRIHRRALLHAPFAQMGAALAVTAGQTVAVIVMCLPGQR
jgi:uncharacterized protein YkwD